MAQRQSGDGHTHGPRSHSLPADRTVVHPTATTALELLGDACVMVDRRLCITYTNRRALTLFGCKRDELVGYPLADAFPEERRELVAEVCARSLREQTSVERTEFFPHWDRWLECRVHPVHDGLFLLVQDVTERRRDELRRLRSEERFRALVEHASDMVSVMDVSGRYSYVSPSHERVLGWPPRALLGRSPAAFIHPDDLAQGSLALSEAIRTPGETFHPLPLRFRHANGSWCTLDLILTNLSGDPSVRGVVVNSRDVTEQETLAAQLRHAQRMEALGQLAGGIAHDFNNVLAAVTGFTQLALDQLRNDDTARDDLEEVLRAAERGAGVARQLLAFGRPVHGEAPRTLDMRTVVREVVRLLRSLIPASIAVELRLPDQPTWVRGVRSQLDQVVMNLAVNARDAMPEGGTLTIALEVVGRAPGREMACLRVRDSGTGITPEDQARLFEPFFTTKPAGRGTGLGLSVVYGIVRHTGGQVTVDSAPGSGSTFNILLPLTGPAREEEREERTEERGEWRGATILLVEDEPAIRRSVRRLLERRGLHVLTAADGAVALELLEERDGNVDVVLTDAAMPHLGGWPLARRIGSQWPSLPVVLMSGHEGGDTDRAPIAAYLEKPFTAAQLLDVVRRAIRR